MSYDFHTLVSRRNTGSAKWNWMDSSAKAVPGEDVIPFSVADMELKNAPEIAEGLAGFTARSILGYTGPTDAYRDAVCGWMRTRHHWQIEPDWIVPFPGVVPALDQLVRLFTEPGDGVIIMPPVYGPFSSAVTQNGRALLKNPLIDTGRGYEIDFDGLESKAKDPRAKMLIFCSPHNPVGRVWTPEEIERVSRICLKNHILVVSDEIHFDLILPGHSHSVFSTVVPEMAENCIICTAPSKTFNLAGLIASNLIIQNEALRKRFLEGTHFGGSVNVLGLKACEIAYTQCAGWLDELLLLLDKNRRLCEDFTAAEIPGIQVRPLEGTYLQWWDCRGLGLAEKELEAFNHEKALLFCNEGYQFGKEGSGFERINLACPTAYLEKALHRLKRALNA